MNPTPVRELRILLAPGPLKGSFSSPAVVRAVERALKLRPKDVSPGAGWDEDPFITVDPAPLADGGDGTAACLARLLGGTPFPLRATGALGDPVRTRAYALGRPIHPTDPKEPKDPSARNTKALAGTDATLRGAAVDLAAVCGLARLEKSGRAPNPLTASTRGLGEALKAAADRVPEGPIFIGLGGSASTDGGVGLLQALGAQALDRLGRPVPPGGIGLLALEHLDLTHVNSSLALRLRPLADVEATLLGPDGSAPLFAPQKGASSEDVHRLEEGLSRLANIAERDLGVSASLRRAPRTGAGGGTGYGLSLLTGSSDGLSPGAAVVLDLAEFENRLQSADVVLTAEGALDRTTLAGKLPAVVLSRSLAAGRPCIFLCARATPDAACAVKRQGGTVAVARVPAGRDRANAWDLGLAALHAVRALPLVDGPPHA